MADAFPPVQAPGVALRMLPSRTRLVLRAAPDPALLARIGAAWGVAPPVAALCSAEAGSRAALWLGPDEWLLLAEEGAAPASMPALAGLPAWLVDISDAHHGFALTGAAATTLLNEGCPLDLDLGAFPVGACTRTLFGKTGILLWRRGAERFELEVARSFAASLHALMAEAAADLDAC